MLLRRGNGQKSTTVTLLWASWIIAIALVVVSLFDIDKEKWGWSIRPVDPSVILFLLSPISALYGWRRKQDGDDLKGTLDRLEK